MISAYRKILLERQNKGHAACVLHSSFPMSPHFTDRVDIASQIEADRLHLKECRRRAEETVRDWGWNEQDEDFYLQVEEEEKRLWMEDLEEEEEMFHRRYRTNIL